MDPCPGGAIVTFLGGILPVEKGIKGGSFFAIFCVDCRNYMPTVEAIIAAARKGTPLAAFSRGTKVRGGGKMSLIKGYSYELAENPGEGFAEGFAPALTPAEILFMGAFEGRYLNDCTDEFPQEWFLYAAAAGKLSPVPNLACNYFGVGSRQPLSVWKENGWAPRRGRHVAATDGRAILADSKQNPDERGWFQWYCRYWLGRRIPALDKVQIGRWRSFARHAGSVKARCTPGKLSCSPRERQALLQWAYNPFI